MSGTGANGRRDNLEQVYRRVREAILEVDAQANRRVTVKPISATDVEQLVVMRVALETEALRLSVERLQPEGIAALEGRLAEMAHFAKAKDYARWTLPHNAFHRGLTAPAGDRTNALLQQLSDHFERYRRVHIARSPARRSPSTRCAA